MNRLGIRLLIILSFVLIVLPNNLLAAPFYEGKMLRIVVGFPPGGGYDRMGRLLSVYLPKYLPGKPKVIVVNLPGAASVIAANNLYNIERPDGLTIGTINAGLPFAQLLGADGIRFDIRKFSWIGSTSEEASLFTVRSDSPYKSVNDLRKAKEPIQVGSSGPANQNYQFSALLKEFAGFNFKLINYPSAPEGLLALERKEVDGQAGTFSSLTPYIKRGLVRPLIQGRIKTPGLESLPIDEDLAYEKRGKTLMALRSVSDSLARPYVAPPNTPPERMKMLRNAFDQVTKDPAFLAEADKNAIKIRYVTSEESLKLLNFILSQPEDIVRDFGKYIKF